MWPFSKKITYTQNVQGPDRVDQIKVTKTVDEWIPELLVELNNTMKRIEDNTTKIAQAQMVMAGMMPRPGTPTSMPVSPAPSVASTDQSVQTPLS